MLRIDIMAQLTAVLARMDNAELERTYYTILGAEMRENAAKALAEQSSDTHCE